MTLRKSILVLSVIGITGILFMASVSANRTSKDIHISAELPVFGQVTDFALTNSENAEVTLASLKGAPWIADFIFTTCGGPCPKMTGQMAALHRDFKDHAGLKFVSISVNPEVDTPEILAAYAKSYEADTARWYFLTGESEKVHGLAVNGFKLGSLDDPIIHSDRFALVYGDGQIRGYYGGTDPDDLAKLTRDASLLLN